MLKSVKGICRNGRIELSEPLSEGAEGEVIVTFLENGAVKLRERGIDEQQATDLRHRLSTFAEYWEQPEMDVFDVVKPVVNVYLTRTVCEAIPENRSFGGFLQVFQRLKKSVKLTADAVR